MKTNILIVDDEQSARDLCVDFLKELDFEIEVAESGTNALAVLQRGQTDIVLSDVRMPGMDGFDLLKIIKLKYPEVDVVMMTGYGTINASVEAMKLGACDYITKPFQIEDFRHRLQLLVEKQELRVENRLLRGQLNTGGAFVGLLGTSATMENVFRLVLKAATKHHPVLILGESGTGKELVARAIHAHGPWKDKPFVAIDCGALAPTLIDSELFGHVRGAFTGADHARQGLLASAQGGTVLLDEFGELPVELQSKLLRALQEHEVRAIGGNQWTRLEARIIAATNRDIDAAIEEGSLRADLYYRLNVLSIIVPPLRERKSDIPRLAYHFIDRHRGESRMTAISSGAMDRLIRYSWPGNVRELENCIQRAIVIGVGPVILEADLPPSMLYDVVGSRIGKDVPRLEETERRSITAALQATGGDRVRAAKMLGIGKTTIYRKLKEFGLEDFLPSKKAS